MDIKFWNQPQSVNLAKILNEKLRKEFKKIWIIAGVAKDSGLEILMDSIEVARNNGIEVNVMIGVDRKNVSKGALSKLLDIGCNLFIHINRDESKVETRIYIFEGDEGKESFIYESAGKFSENGLSDSYSVIEEILYTPQDIKVFENAKSTILQGLEDVFIKTDNDELRLLAERGEVVARIIERKIPKISELYGESSISSIANDMYDEENNNSNMFNIQANDDIDIDIDIEMDGQVKKVEMSAEAANKKDMIELENIEKVAGKRLSKFYEETEDEEAEKKVSIIKDTDNLDFSNMSIFVFELNKIIDKGLGEGEIKIPNYLFEKMKSFFEEADFTEFTDEKGKLRIGKKISLKIIDVATNNIIKDDETYLYEEDRYLAIKSKEFKKINSEENDIARLIKESENNFCIELIRKDIREYSIWEDFCNHTMKNSRRKFGIM